MARCGDSGYHRLGILEMITRSISPFAMRRVADVAEGVQPAGRKGHDREEGPAHHGHARGGKRLGRPHEAHLGPFVLEVNQGEAGDGKEFVDPRVGAVEDQGALDRRVAACMSQLDSNTTIAPLHVGGGREKALLHTGFLKEHHDTPLQPYSVENDLLHLENIFDEQRIEEAFHRALSRLQGSADSVAEELELGCVHTRKVASDCIVLIELVVDTVAEIGKESLVVGLGTGTGEKAAGVVIPVVDPGLVRIGSLLQEVCFGLHQQDRKIQFLLEVRRESTAVETASDHDRIEALVHLAPPGSARVAQSPGHLHHAFRPIRDIQARRAGTPNDVGTWTPRTDPSVGPSVIIPRRGRISDT